MLDAALQRKDISHGGRPPFDAVLMFKVLVLQALYNLSDEDTEYQILDRQSFMHFLGLDVHDTVPDANAVAVPRDIAQGRRARPVRSRSCLPSSTGC